MNRKHAQPSFDTATDTALDIDLDAGPQFAEEACRIMHRAFAQYSRTGQPSGALLEDADSLRDELEDGTRLAIVRVGGEIVAMTKHRIADDGTIYFGRPAVPPEARGRGLAGALVRALRAEARAEGLDGLSCAVRADEAENIAVYEHMGMEITGSEERRSLTGALIPVVTMHDVRGHDDR